MLPLPTPSLQRLAPRLPTGRAPARYTLRTLQAGLALLAAAVTGPAALAQTPVPEPVLHASLDFAAYAQDGVRSHIEQIRARQQRVRNTHGPALPVFSNGLTLAGDNKTIPLQLRQRPRSGQPRLAPSSTLNRVNGFVRGNLQNDERPGSDPSLSTTNLTAGTDYRFSRELMVGLAAGRLATAAARGATVSAYLTLSPIERLHLDLSLSLGQHRARDDASFGAAAGRLESRTRALSLSLKHPREFAGWTWQPYSRLDRMLTDIDLQSQRIAMGAISRERSALSIGSTVETLWSTPFGTLRPMLLLEMQREIVNGNALQPESANTHSLVGFGLSTRLTRDMSAFAQSRYAVDGSESLDKLVMLGLRVGF